MVFMVSIIFTAYIHTQNHVKDIEHKHVLKRGNYWIIAFASRCTD